MIGKTAAVLLLIKLFRHYISEPWHWPGFLTLVHMLAEFLLCFRYDVQHHEELNSSVQDRSYALRKASSLSFPKAAFEIVPTLREKLPFILHVQSLPQRPPIA